MVLDRVRGAPAHTPEEIHDLLAAAFTAGDIDAFGELYEPEATTVIPPKADQVTGREEIRNAALPTLALKPRFVSEVVGKLEGEGLALTHARWALSATGPDGADVALTGRGTIVSRRQPDGSWRIVLDNPLSPE